MTTEGASFAYFLPTACSGYIKRTKFSPVGSDATFGRRRDESRVKKLSDREI